MDDPHLDPLPMFYTIGNAERANVMAAMFNPPLSGYLGGVDSAGYWVEKLSADWCDAFKCWYAIPCNSATSGLLAACMAVGVDKDSVVWTSDFTMSASAACARVLGARTVFIDIETTRFSMNSNLFHPPFPKCIIVTNLFGHPAYLAAMRMWCDSNNVWMIEDNAQAPFATEGSQHAGTIGHIGVFSLNVHKAINSGEGGVIVTNDTSLAEGCRGAINHGELAGAERAGLNLRMTEPIAAIACAQLAKGPGIIKNRRELALDITEMFAGVPWIHPQGADTGCNHSFYILPIRVLHGKRDLLVQRLKELGFPVTAGYSIPLHKLFKSSDQCHTTDLMERELMTIEICKYDPTPGQRRKMAEVVKYAIDEVVRHDRYTSGAYA